MTEKKNDTSKGRLNILLLAVALVAVGRLLTIPPNAPTSINNYKELPRWTPGMLDIHHLQVGSSVSTFVVMPDGTTMLIDAGDLIKENALAAWKKLGPPFDTLNLKSPYPNDSHTPVEWIIEYMKDFWPYAVNEKLELDYVLISHFHSDHIGDGTESQQRPKSASGNYILSGIPELASKFKIKTILDRGYPDYNVPQGLRGTSVDIDNYLRFVEENKDTISFGQFEVGVSSQIHMKHDPEGKHNFSIRVVKSGLDVAAPFDPLQRKEERIPVEKIEGDILGENGHGNENTMSAAIVIEYDNFRYYEGADQEIVRNKKGDIILDTIGPTAKAAGKVDVATLNHHGHGVSQDYLEYIDPAVMVLQGWSSDQPPKESLEMITASRFNETGLPREIFATDMFQEVLTAVGKHLSLLFKSTSGHVVVRVHSRREEDSVHRQKFEVIILDGFRRIKSHRGIFPVRASARFVDSFE